MTRRMRGLALAVLASAAIGVVVAGCEGSEGSNHMAAEESRPAPEFQHPDLDGNLVRLADLRGKTVVIDFWATWCAPCVFQPAELNRVWQAHRDAGDVVVLGLEVGGASAEEIRAWAEENEAVAQYPILRGADEALARRYGILGFPALAVIDPEGEIDSIHLGLTTADEVEAAIAPLRGS